MKLSAKILATVAACLATAIVPAVQADTVYTLGAPNTDLSAYPSPYGTVTVHLTDSTHATITFQAGSISGPPSYTYKFGSSGSADVNVNGTFSVGSLSGFSSPTTHINPAGSVSTFGKLNLQIDNFDGSGHAFTSASFLLTATGVTAWSDSLDVLTADTAGYLAAAHVFVYDSAGTNVKTGYAGNSGPPVQVPDSGSTVALLGLALLGITAFRRRTARG